MFEYVRGTLTKGREVLVVRREASSDAGRERGQINAQLGSFCQLASMMPLRPQSMERRFAVVSCCMLRIVRFVLIECEVST